jgi:putative cell wall-binding protein
VTTATRRLRRSAVATLAATVTAGVAILATSTSAFAAELTVGTQIGTATATTVYPGTTAQAVGDLQIAVPNNLFHIGDTITVQLAGAGASCGTTNGAVGYSAAPTVTATGPFTAAFGSTAGSTTDTAPPTFTAVLQSSAGACTTAGVKDQVLITLTSSSTGVITDSYTLALTGTNANVGSAVTPGAVTEKPTNGAAVTVANVANTKASISAVTSVTAAAATQAVVAGVITLSDVGAAQVIVPPIYLTVSGTGAVFTPGVLPTVTGPTGSTYTVVATTTTLLTITAGGTALPTTNNTFTITGTSVTVPVGNGLYSLTASYGSTAPPASATNHTIGATLAAIAVSAQSRIGGIDRYASSAQLFNSKFNVNTVHSVVLASGANFPDALSATYLAATLGTGVVLTDPNVLPQQTSQVLTNGFITTVYIVGGTAAVSAAEQNLIATLHTGNAPLGPLLTVLRVAGADRYATNNAADLFSGAGAGSTTAVVATGTNFADALAAGPAVYAGAVANKPFPLVLTDGTTLSASAKSTLTNLGITKVVIAGGTSAISAGVEAAIKALPGITIAYRLAGADRTLTASMIATWETSGLAATSTYGALASLGFGKSTTTNAYIARGDGFADALSAGAVAGSNKLVILLTGDPNTLGAGIPSYLGTATFVNVGGLIAVGLTSAVSNATFAAAVASL